MKIIPRILLALMLCVPGVAQAQDGRAQVERPGHREWSWDGGSSLRVGGAMIVRVRPDGPARVVITGPEDQLEHVFLRSGHIGLDNGGSWWRRGWSDRSPLQVTISGVTLNEVTVSGSSQVTLGAGAVRPDDFSVRVSGSGSITAGGQVRQLDARVSGSGSARLGDLSARQGEVSVSGSGSVTVEALDAADVSISGSGHVRIHDRPRTLEHSISGSGRLAAGGDIYSRRNRR